MGATSEMIQAVNTAKPPVPRFLRLTALWALCSACALAFFMGIEVGAGRLIIAAKVEEIGVWGIYVGVPLQQIAQAMLTPATASRVTGLPGWLDVVFGLTIAAVWGALALAVIHWLYRPARAP